VRQRRFQGQTRHKEESENSMAKTNRGITLVTGASSSIGYARIGRIHEDHFLFLYSSEAWTFLSCRRASARPLPVVEERSLEAFS
jgi:hypothetical protein